MYLFKVRTTITDNYIEYICKLDGVFALAWVLEDSNKVKSFSITYDQTIMLPSNFGFSNYWTKWQIK